MSNTQFGKLFLVSAPSGAGKTSLVNSVISSVGKQYNLQRVVTYTSRNPRNSEVDGKDYCFVSKEQFCNLQSQNFFLESSDTYGYWYGTPRSICDNMERGISYIVVIDRLGAQKIVEQVSAILIWIYVQNISELKKRLISRNQNSQKETEQRLLLAQKEIQQEDQSCFYEHHVLNDNFNQAVFLLQNIIKNSLKYRYKAF